MHHLYPEKDHHSQPGIHGEAGIPERIKKNHHGRVSERHKRDHFPAGGKRNFT